ncbi:MAG: penicillin-binding protein 2 [Nitrospinae bacterium]|nr:penicillin-binding protein 2 [Nitrospinota bacterium]
MFLGHLEKKTKFKIYLVLILFIACFGAVWEKLYHIQIKQHEWLLNLSNKQYYRTFYSTAQRGAIYDRAGRDLALSVETDSVYANPLAIENSAHTAKSLSSTLDINWAKLNKELNREKGFVWIKRKITPDEAEAVDSLNIKGVGLLKEGRRFYPKRELAARMIGFVGTDNKGLYGVEYFYDDYLRGKSGRIMVERDALGRGVNFAEDYRKSGEAGYDIKLTIDEVIQYITEKELAAQVTKHRAKGGTAIVMDPSTGEILAMADQPQFNPNSFALYKEGNWRNNAVTHSFEPGSVFKIILTAAAIEEKIAGQNDTFFCENGEIEIGGTVIHEAEEHKYKWLTVKEIIGKSSNIGAIKIAQKLGAKRFHDYISKFGIGIKTGIDIPGESAGQVRDITKWSGTSLASISFGQEISVTPIQLITAVSAVANGGILMRPHIVKAIEDEGIAVKEFKPEVVRRVVSEKTCRELTDILEYTVKYGTGKKAIMEGYSVAGKTGTAQKADQDIKGYSKDKFVSTFIGYVPSKNPKLAILVIIDEPEGMAWGGEVAAPVFKEIARQTLRYLKVPSEKNGMEHQDTRAPEHQKIKLVHW